MTTEIDRQTPDFLIADKFADTTDEFRQLSLNNQILLGIWREIRKAHPSQRAVISPRYSNPLQVLNDSSDTVEIRFLASGKPILSQYLVVSNNTDIDCQVALNEPVVLAPNTTFGNGIRLLSAPQFGNVLQIPVELEYISIRIDSKAPGAAAGVTINNGTGGTGIPNTGTIQVYAWTIPFSDKEDTE